MALTHLPTEPRRLIRGLKPYDIIVVAWEDAYTVIRDTSFEEAYHMAGKEIYMRNTLGFVVRADDEYIVIAGTDDRDSFASQADVADMTVLCSGFVRDI